MPIKIKINIIVRKSCVKAKEIALPKNGAEQGVARRTARIPDKKLGIKIFFCISFSEIFLSRNVAKIWLKLISKIPKSSAIKSVKIIIKKVKKNGFWNWNPQPKELPADWIM